MRLIFTGSAGAFTTADDNYQSNMVLAAGSDPPQRLLIDCGSDARWSLKALGLDHSMVGSVFISHTHADHVGGLEWLGLTTRYDPATARPRLITRPELLSVLWDNVLAGGLAWSTEGALALADYFATEGVTGSFTWAGTRFDLVPARHVVHAGTTMMAAYGLAFTAAGWHVLITGDTIFDPDRLGPAYDRADIIFHDCETGPETGVHATYAQLRQLPPTWRSKMWLYHYQPSTVPDAVADGFRGFVTRGQVFDLARPETLAAGAYTLA